MKNGDPRSRVWIKRTLPQWTRDIEGTQTRLLLVDVTPTPSLDEISSWTDAQCLLADDWAFACHISASDNNNRVPARPGFLVPYDRRYPQRTPPQVAADAVQAMRDDNSAYFVPTPQQWERLAAAFERMQKAGCFFTDAEIDLLAAGEHGEMLDHFQQYDGLDDAQKTMCEIFEGIGIGEVG